MTFAGFQNSHEYPYYSSTLHRYVRTISYLAKFWDHIIVFASFDLYILRVTDVSNHFCGYYHRLLRKKKKRIIIKMIVILIRIIKAVGNLKE